MIASAHALAALNSHRDQAVKAPCARSAHARRIDTMMTFFFWRSDPPMAGGQMELPWALGTTLPSTKEASLNDTLSTYGGNVSSGRIERFRSSGERV